MSMMSIYVWILMLCFSTFSNQLPTSNATPMDGSCSDLPSFQWADALDKASLVLAGRVRTHTNYPRLDSNSKQIDDGAYNMTFLVTTHYKGPDLTKKLIIVGQFSDPTMDDGTGRIRNQIGCLSESLVNSKFILFLDPVQSGLKNDYFTLVNRAVPYTEELHRELFMKVCATCFAPQVDHLPDTEVEHGHKLTATCSATGNPSPTLVWIKNGRSLDVTDKGVGVETIEISDTQIESVLEINDLIRFDSGEYSCKAVNSIGESTKVFNLKVKKPGIQSSKPMEEELVVCGPDYRDHCLNGGQCYMLKSDRTFLQCRCHQEYYGDRCHYHIGGLMAFAEARDATLQSMLKDLTHGVISHLSWSIWISSALTVLVLSFLLLKDIQLCKVSNKRGHRKHKPIAKVSQPSKQRSLRVPEMEHYDSDQIPITPYHRSNYPFEKVPNSNSSTLINNNPLDRSIFDQNTNSVRMLYFNRSADSSLTAQAGSELPPALRSQFVANMIDNRDAPESICPPFIVRPLQHGSTLANVNQFNQNSSFRLPPHPAPMEVGDGIVLPSHLTSFARDRQNICF